MHRTSEYVQVLPIEGMNFLPHRGQKNRCSDPLTTNPPTQQATNVSLSANSRTTKIRESFGDPKSGLNTEASEITIRPLTQNRQNRLRSE
jgi:hypothetical protein